MNATPDPLAALAVGGISKVEVPKLPGSRAAEPNPFVVGKHFPADEQALELTVEGAMDSALVKKLTKQARAAAILVDRTARVNTVQSGPKTKPATKLVIWTIPKVVRARKPAEEAAEAAPEAASE